MYIEDVLQCQKRPTTVSKETYYSFPMYIEDVSYVYNSHVYKVAIIPM